VPACAELKFGLDVVFEVPNQELSHGAMIARYRRAEAAGWRGLRGGRGGA
jgi:hypothetical protein